MAKYSGETINKEIFIPGPPLLQIAVLSWRQHNCLHDYYLGIRTHGRDILLQDFDQVLVRPAVADMAHHVHCGTVQGLRLEEVMGLVANTVAELGGEGGFGGGDGFFEILNDKFELGEALGKSHGNVAS